MRALTLKLSTRSLSAVEAIISYARVRASAEGWVDEVSRLFDPLDTQLPRSVRSERVALQVSIDQALALNTEALRCGEMLLGAVRIARGTGLHMAEAKLAEQLAAVAAVLTSIATASCEALKEREASTDKKYEDRF